MGPRAVAHQAFLAFIISQRLLKFMSIESMMPSNHLSSVAPFSLHHTYTCAYIYIVYGKIKYWISDINKIVMIGFN